MKLHALQVVSVEGLRGPFELEFGPGLNVVHGGNASGKSTIARLIHDDLFVVGQGVRGEADLSWSLDGQPDRRVRHRLRPHGGEPHPFARRRPGLEHAACYLLRAADLLAGDGEDDRRIAARLQRELAGGLDLPALRLQLRRPDPRQDARQLGQAQARLREAERRHRELATEEEELEDLDRRIAAGVAARGRVLLLEARVRMLAQELRRDPLLIERAGLPAELARLPGGARERRQELEEVVEGCLVRVGRARAEVQDLDRDQHGAWAGRRPFQGRELDRLQALIAGLDTAIADWRQAEDRGRAATARLAGREALVTLHGRDADDAELRQLARLIEDSVRAEHQVEALERERARLLDDRDREDEDPDELRHGLDALERWLAPIAEEPLAIRNRLALAAVGLVLGVVLALALELPWFSALGGFALGLLWAEWAARQRREELRRRAWADFLDAETGLELEAEVAAAQRGRRVLQQRIQRAEATQLRDQARRRLESELRLERPRAEEIRGERRRALARLGIEDAGILSLVQVHHHDAVLQARRDDDVRRGAEADLAEAQEACDGIQAEARELARSVGAELPEELDALGCALRRLQDEHRLLVALGDRRRDAARRLAERQEELVRAEERRRAFHAPLGLEPDDDGGFRRLLELAERQRVIDHELGPIEAFIAVESETLRGHPDLLALRDPELALELEAARGAAADVEPLRNRATEIRTRVRAAADEARLEQALADRDRARARLEGAREEALRATIQLLLLDRLAEDEHRVESQVLDRSRRLFNRFTRDAFSLEVVDGRLAARDNRAAVIRALDELSDGTRVQLLMAARIAFLESIEEGEKLPLLLDEILASSDPERFAAIADLLLDEAASGRQIIYFSANPEDILRLEDRAAARGEDGPRIVALGEIESADAARWRERRRQRRAARSLPEPLGLSAADYAEAIGLESPDWRRPASEVHLFHLLDDRLDVLHRLLGAGIDSLGVWRSARATGSAALTDFPENEARRLDLLGHAVDRLFERKAVGRDRRLRPADLREDFGRSRAFPALCAILERERGSARALIAAIESREIGRFHHLDRLREIAEDGGFLAIREPLDDGSILQDLLGHFAAEIDAGTIAIDDLRRVLAGLLADLGK